MSDGGRPRAFTKTEVSDLLMSDERPVWTQSQIADALDVSYNSVANHSDIIKSITGVETTEVAGSTVYYFDRDEARSDWILTPDPPTTVNPRSQMRAAASHGLWEIATQRVREAPSEETTTARAWLHRQLVDIIEEFNLNNPTVDMHMLPEDHTGESSFTGDWNWGAFDPEDWPVPEEKIVYHLYEVPLYSSADAGPIHGFASLLTEQPIESGLYDEDAQRVSVSDSSAETIDEVLPTLADIEHAGSVWFDFMAAMYDW